MSIMLYLAGVKPAVYRRLLAGDEPWTIPEQSTCLDKSWSVLYRYLNFPQDLANPTWMAQGICGGEPFRAGAYGGPRALSPRHVAQVAEALMGADNDINVVLGNIDRYRNEAHVLYEHVDQNGAYGSPMPIEQIAEDFVTLRNFYRDAAFADDAVIITLT